jgi:RNA polymerase sigma-70 factor (ECF subfamily)
MAGVINTLAALPGSSANASPSRAAPHPGTSRVRWWIDTYVDGGTLAIAETAGPGGRRLTVTRADEDRAWVAAAQRGSGKAIEALVRHHWPAAHRAAYLIVQDAAAAEDIAQDSLLAAIDALDRFDNRRPLSPWLYRIVVNNALKWLRAAPRRREVGVERAVAGEDIAAGRQVSDKVLAALRALDIEQRVVVVLRYLFEYTPGEIALALALPRGTVNSRLRRALDRLGEELGEEFE